MDDPVQIEKVLDYLVHNIAQILFIGSLVIQISPIKINPWSALFKWLGKVITADSNKRIDSLIKKLERTETSIIGLQKNIDENEKDRIRWEVLDFANSCRNGKKHTKDEYQHIITLNTKYKDLLKRTKDKNGVFEEEYKYIQKLYAERQEKNDFL